MAADKMNLQLAVQTYGGHMINDQQAMVKCPAHDDRTPSLGLTNGHKELWKCFAGCEQNSIYRALKNDGVIDSKYDVTASVYVKDKPQIKAVKKQEPVTPCNAETYLKHTGLSKEVVEKFGGRFTSYGLEMDYYLEGDDRAYTKTRRNITGQPKYMWATDTPKPAPYIYGRQFIEHFAENDYHLNIVEGESDAQTLWAHGLAAVGISGANAIKSDLINIIKLFKSIFVFKEPDEGGDKFVKGILSLDLSQSADTPITVVALPKEVEDINKLFTLDKKSFIQNYHSLLST